MFKKTDFVGVRGRVTFLQHAGDLDVEPHSRRLQPGSAAQADRRRRMTAPVGESLLGKWRITSMEAWDSAYVDMLGPAYIQIDDAGGGMAFGAVQIGLQCEYGKTSIWFRLQGSDEMDEISGDGDAELEENGTLSGEIRFDNGDESSFRAKRW